MKINLKFRTHFLILLFPILCTACLSNVETPFVEEDPTAADPCESITYTLNVKPIIDANCIQCHGAGGNFPNLTTYNGISSNAGLVKAETGSRRMPQGGSLTAEEIKAISCWVDAGALNN
jgi:mono/diheme cytochrome c family protein